MMQEESYSKLSKRSQGSKLQVPKAKILCNYFPLNFSNDIEEIYIFGIQMTPHLPLEKLALRTRILSLLEIEISRVITKPVIVGMQIYSLSAPLATEKIFSSGEYQIKVKQKQVVKMKDNTKGLLVVLQKVIRGLMVRKNFNVLGKTHKYFDMKKKIQHYAVNVYSGYHVNFVYSEPLFFLRIDSVRKIVCSQTALDAIDYCYKSFKHKDREERRRFIKEKMIGRTVMANYGKNMFYKIKDIQFQNLQLVRIEDSKPLIEYYEEKYGVYVKNLSQPLLVIANKKLEKQNKKCFLIPELCFMVGLPHDIDEVKQRNILTAMKLQPEESRSQAKQMMENLAEAVDEWKSLAKIGIQLDSNDMCMTECKKFPKPQLMIGQDLKVERGLETLFNIACRPIYDGKNSLKCAILYFNRVDVTFLHETLLKNSQHVGAQVQFCKFDIGEFSNNKALTQIETTIDQACTSYKPNMILLIVPNPVKPYYRKLKRMCLVQYKVLSQFVTENVLIHRHNVTIFGKILLQMLAKRRNILWVPKQLTTLPQKNKIMLISYDTSKYGSETIVSTCCTEDDNYTVAFSRFGVCPQNNEKSAELLELMIKNAIDCIEFWKKKNSGLPDQIIFISRKGSISVGEKKFKEKFILPIKKCLKEEYDDAFRMTYIFVETKDNTKFFIHENPHTKARNSEIGTVVDEKIVPKNQFLIVTQSTPGVSAIPVRFIVLDSDSKIPKTMLQQLLFNQCFAYANYTGLVQTPAILQYAKKCAKYISQAPFSEKIEKVLEESPYYL